jgi:hypothetical protein
MKRKVFNLIICLFFAQITSYSQGIDKVERLDLAPQEFVYIHFNTELLFPGENLYYSVYCLNSFTEKLSEISKIVYVQLVDEEGIKLFNHKVRLEKGRGQGDFKIPISTPSGNYKLISYTQWMKNASKLEIFQSDITIVNPYSSDQKIFYINEEKENFKKIQKKRSIEELTSKELEIKIDRKDFEKRSKVSISLLNPKKIKGKFSLSVRKIDEIDLLQKRQITSNTFLEKSKNNLKGYKHITFLPELRGELISGTLFDGADKKPMANKNVAFSIFQKDFILKTSKTDKDGKFYFNINESYISDKGMFQVLGFSDKKNKIVFDNASDLEEVKINFGKLKISKNYNNYILKRSIYNQIENEYIKVKQDSLKKLEGIDPFFLEYDKVYNLEDYSRFSTVKETFVEIIKYASIVSRDDGVLEFYIKPLDPYKNGNQKIGVIVDGILLQEYSELLNFNAKKINKISVKRTDQKLVFGKEIFDGFLVFETYKNDFIFNNVKSLKEVELFKPELNKKYFKRNYFNNNNTRIPDFRNQLLWMPKIQIDEKKLNINFFTSDNSGKFEISIEGFTEKGVPISIRRYFIVK